MEVVQQIHVAEIVRRLRRRIEESGLTQTATDLGVAPSTLHQTLYGKRGIGPTILRALGIRKCRVVTYEEVKHATGREQSRAQS